MKKQILVLMTVVTFLCQAGLQAETSYRLVDLGTLGGATSRAYSINDSDQIVGYAEDNQGRLRATLFDPTSTGNNRDLYTIGGDESGAYAINESGQIVGTAEKSDGERHGTIYDTISGTTVLPTLRDLGTLIGGGWSRAWSINNTGYAVGQAYDNQEGERAALFILDAPGSVINLGTLGGGSSCAYSVNDAKRIVGQAGDNWARPRATLFDPTGARNNIDLGALGGIFSKANSINNQGQIVGSAENNDGLWHATLFDPTGAGNNRDLGGIGGDQSWAESINDDGQIVGQAEISTGQAHATLFDPTGGGNNIDLNTVTNPYSGWTLICANDINASGRIVGWGYNPEGKDRAFLLIPCLYRLAGDLNNDCRVDFADFAVMAENWLVDCVLDPTNPACVHE
jgi:probable HAF family extracellular repeat protein